MFISKASVELHQRTHLGSQFSGLVSFQISLSSYSLAFFSSPAGNNSSTQPKAGIWFSFWSTKSFVSRLYLQATVNKALAVNTPLRTERALSWASQFISPVGKFNFDTHRNTAAT